MTNDTRAAFEAWCIHGKPADAWTNWQLCWAASRRAALDEAIQYLMALNAKADGSHNYYHFAANGLRALGDEGVKL